jgi:tetratricopeptide (TPR) repeat protein
MDFFLSEPLLVMVRFGRWDDILATPPPDPKYAALSGLWHHAHGMALAATGDIEPATADLQALRRIAAEVPPELLTGLNAGKAVLELAAVALEARIAEASKKPDAIALWERAVALEDQLAYNEPADWFYPVRHYLGAALLDAGHAKQAETVFRDDLLRNPHNGWALYGLWRSLERQGQKSAAKKAEKRFREAWAAADLELTRAAF